MTTLQVSRSELILGGQKSGKSWRAECLAQTWLAQSGDHHVVLIATAQAWDKEMGQRIARHQADRAERLPGIITVEEPIALAGAVAQHSTQHTMVLVDCLTLWLTNLTMPFQPTHSDGRSDPLSAGGPRAEIQIAALIQAVGEAPGPVVLVGNEIGLGVIPMGAEVRSFVDQLGMLNQAVAARCERVTLMAAGLALTLKENP